MAEYDRLHDSGSRLADAIQVPVICAKVQTRLRGWQINVTYIPAVRVFDSFQTLVHEGFLHNRVDGVDISRDRNMNWTRGSS